MKEAIKIPSGNELKLAEAVDNMPVERELKTIIVINKDSFDSNKKYLIDIKADFIHELHGSSESLIYNDVCIKFVDIAEKAGKGYHITKMVRKDVDMWLANHGEQLQPHGRTYREQLFNINAIEKVIGAPMVAVDANDCYWRTIYMLGYMTERTYIMGLKKKEWKEGRLSAIGGLAAPKMVCKYVKGKCPNYNRIYTPPDMRYQYIRNHVVGHVYNVFYELFQHIGADFYMFLTDCVYTDYDRLNYVKDFLTHHGYRHKNMPIEFTAIDRKKKIVRWYDFTAKCKGKRRCAKQCQCQNKYYEYSNNQLISDGLLEGKLGEETKNRWLSEKEAKKRDALKDLIKMSA